MDLESRMKSYEDVNRYYLTRRLPAIIRVDGKAFHTFTKGMQKPWDHHLRICMMIAAQRLCENISGAKIAYIQSDEINVLFTDYDTLETEPWFNKNVQKIASISSSIATASFNQTYQVVFGSPKDHHKLAFFDARVFTLPHDEVCNYFLWRQRDATNNSIQMLAQSQFSQKQIHGLNTDQLQDKLFKECGINWNDCRTVEKRGTCVVRINDRWVFDEDIPIFSKDRNYINRFVYLAGE